MGAAPVRKPTTFKTNSIEMKKLLERPCPGYPRHVQLLSGGAAAAQVYSKALCRALYQGIVKREMDSELTFAYVNNHCVLFLFPPTHEANLYLKYIMGAFECVMRCDI